MIKNEQRFTGRAEIYKKYRSSYPKELIEYLYSQVGFKNGSIIADIGSGTGIFSRLLLEKGSSVYGVEPNEDMRLMAENDSGGFENFISINAPAENTGLKANSVDFITAAESFHWFDMELFRAECRRILKNGRKVVLTWNRRDMASDFAKKCYEIRLKYCIDTKGLGENGGPPKYIYRFFADGSCEKKAFRNDMTLDRETYIGMNLSRSYAPKEDKHPDKYYGFVEEMNALFDEHSVNGKILFGQYAESYVGKID